MSCCEFGDVGIITNDGTATPDFLKWTIDFYKSHGARNVYLAGNFSQLPIARLKLLVGGGISPLKDFSNEADVPDERIRTWLKRRKKLWVTKGFVPAGGLSIEDYNLPGDIDSAAAPLATAGGDVLLQGVGHVYWPGYQDNKLNLALPPKYPDGEGQIFGVAAYHARGGDSLVDVPDDNVWQIGAGGVLPGDPPAGPWHLLIKIHRDWFGDKSAVLVGGGYDLLRATGDKKTDQEKAYFEKNKTFFENWYKKR